MRLPQLVLIIGLSALTAFAVGKYTSNTTFSPKNTKETAFDQVIRTNTLRCGYMVIPPQLQQDPNTGKLSGVAYDLIQEAGKRLNISIDWTEEVTFQTVAEGLKTGRYDSFCLTAYRWEPSARVMEYTSPLFYSTTNIYARAKDKRFDNKTNLINKPTTKVATIDGEASTFIRQTDFPLSAQFSMPQNTDYSFLLESVATKKADITFANPLMVMPYLVAHPNTIKKVQTKKPLRSYAHAFSFNKGEHSLTSMFNLVLQNMVEDGTVDTILNTYEKVPHSFVRIKSPISTQ